MPLASVYQPLKKFWNVCYSVCPVAEVSANPAPALSTALFLNCSLALRSRSCFIHYLHCGWQRNSPGPAQPDLLEVLKTSDFDSIGIRERVKMFCCFN